MNGKGFGWMVILSALSAGLSQGAIADPSSASASVVIDWSHLKFSVTGINGVVPSVEYTNPSTSLFSRASADWLNIVDTESESTRDWTNSISTLSSVDIPSHYAQAQTSAYYSTSSASTKAEVPTLFEDNSLMRATATGSRQINFSSGGPGTIVLTVPYTLTMNVLNCADNCGVNYARIDASANFRDTENIGVSSFNSSIVLEHGQLKNEELSQSGNLILGIVADGAGHGSLSINFDIASTVPEPETYAMLLAGLGLVGFMARRRRRMG
jgi:hypothetical protein